MIVKILVICGFIQISVQMAHLSVSMVKGINFFKLKYCHIISWHVVEQMGHHEYQK